jgi:predicted RNA-binding Zn-ribbon protein involved in translation (DUF1610 family)
MRVKSPVCPNCSGTAYREVLITAISRNIVHDDAPPACRGSGISAERRHGIVKLLCIHCGHELSRNGRV